MNKMTIRDIDLSGKRVLVRVDFNVPLAGGRVTDDTRIRAAIPTLRAILDEEPRAIILMSHLGRPKGEPAPAMSLAPVAPALAELLGIEVAFADDCIGESVDAAIEALCNAGLILLENTRFHTGETANDAAFAAALARHGDVFVNDAFGTAHRAHASNVGVAARLPAVAGLLVEKEIDYLATALEAPERPFVAVLGGAKVSGKIDVIEALLGKVDKLLIGGGMANTFFAAQGRDMAESLVEAETRWSWRAVCWWRPARNCASAKRSADRRCFHRRRRKPGHPSQRRRAGRLAVARYRACHHPRLRRCARGRADDRLEWSHGRV